MATRKIGTWVLPAASAIVAGHNMYNAAKCAQTGSKHSTGGHTRARRRAHVRTKTKVSVHQRGRQNAPAGSFSSFFYGRRLVPKRQYNAYNAIASQMHRTNVSGVAEVGSRHSIESFIHRDLSSKETGVAEVGSRKVLFESVTLQNQCNMNIHVILYDIIARKNLDSQTNISWVHGHRPKLGYW